MRAHIHIGHVAVGAGSALSTIGLMVIFGGTPVMGSAVARDGDFHSAESSSLLPPEKEEPRQTYAYSDFPTNARGQTYGSDAQAETLRDAPDLVAVVGDNGIAGFVLKHDLDGPPIRTPEDAVAWEANLRQAPVIPVYDVEGERVVDSFTLQLGEVSYVPPK